MIFLAAALTWLLCAGTFAAGQPPWLAGPAALTIALSLPARTWVARCAALFAAALVLLYAVFQLHHTSGPTALGQPAGVQGGSPLRLLVRADAEAVAYPAYQTVTARLVATERDGGWESTGGRVRLRLDPNQSIESGDLLEVYGTPREVAATADGYARWEHSQGITVDMTPKLVRLRERPPASIFQRVKWDARDTIARGLTATLPPTEAAFASALLFGTRHALPSHLYADLAATGTSHIVALSSYKLVLLYATLTALLAPLIGRRRAVLAAWLGAYICGASMGGSVSMVRAEIVLALFALATISGRPYGSLVLLTCVAAAMSLPDAEIVGDAAFQLTFLAAAGISLAAGPLRTGADRLLQGIGGGDALPVPVRIVLDAFMMSLAVALFTAPVAVMQFGTVQIYAPLVNALITPLVGILTLLSLAVGALGTLWPAGGSLPAAFLWLLFIVVEEVAHFGASLPGASLHLPAFIAVALTAMFITMGALPRLGVRLWSPLGKAPLRSASKRHLLKRRPGSPSLVSGGLIAALLLTIGATFVVVRSQGIADGLEGARATLVDVGGVAGVLVTGANGSRILVTDSNAPQAVTQSLESAGVHGPIDVVVRSKMTTQDDVRGVAAVATALGSTAIVSPAPAGAVDQAPTGVAEAPRASSPAVRGIRRLETAGRESIDLGAGDHLDLYNTGHGLGTVLLTTGRLRLILSGASGAERILDQWQEPSFVDAVVLTHIPPASISDLLRNRAPLLLILAGTWANSDRDILHAVAPGARIVVPASASRLSVGNHLGQLQVSYQR